MWAFGKPRKEYKEGELPLSARLPFSTGETACAFEDKSGIAHIFLEKNGRTLLDFTKLLQRDFKFVSPKYLLRIGQRDRAGGWYSDPARKLVYAGDTQYKTWIFSLLHEIGHSYDYSNEREMAETFGLEAVADMHKKLKEEAVEKQSVHERNAWARAIRIARGIKKQFGTNLFEVFKDLDQFEKFVHGCLLSHAIGKEEELLKMRSWQERIWDELRLKLFGDSTKSRERKFVEELFDKGYINRKSTRNLGRQ